MDGINQTFLFGHLGADPELKQTPKGPLLKMRMATTRVWFDKEDHHKEERTTWHRVTVFGKRAEYLAQKLRKGMPVTVKGRIETNDWEKDGVKHHSYDIIAEDVGFGQKSSNGAALPPAYTPLADLPEASTLPF